MSLRPLWTTPLALLAFMTSLSAADDRNVQLMKQMYSKFSQVVGIGASSALAENEYLVFANPGILIDPDIDPSKQEDRYRLSRVLDRVLIPDFRYRSRNESTLSIYQTILDFKETPVIVPTPEQRRRLDDAYRLMYVDGNVELQEYTAAFESFKKKRRNFMVALDRVETTQRSDPNGRVPTAMILDLEEAREDWDLLGRRTEMEGAVETARMYGNLDPNVWWNGLRNRFNRFTEVYQATPFARFDLYPDYRSWLDTSREWSKFGLNDADLEMTQINSSSSVGGGIGVSFGLWSFGADYNHSEDRTYQNTVENTFDLKFEITRVQVDRPWMESMVFRSKAWRWLPSSPLYDRLISDGGDAKGGTTPNGEMPFVSTGLLLARNVKLAADWRDDTLRTLNEHTSAGGSIGWGPFSFGGRYDSAKSESYTHFQRAGNTLSFDAAQIIGVYVEVLPKSPDPDASLPFPHALQPQEPEGPTDAAVMKAALERADKILHAYRRDVGDAPAKTNRGAQRK